MVNAFSKWSYRFVYFMCFLGIVLILDAWRRADTYDKYDAYPEIARTYFNARVQWLVGMFILGGVAWFFSRYVSIQNPAKGFIIRSDLQSAPISRTYWFLGIVGMLLIVLLTFWSLPQYQFYGWRPPIEYQLSNYEQLVMLLLGSILWIVGFMNFETPLRLWQSIKQSWRTYWREWCLVFILTAVAFGIRVYRLDTTIPVMVSDESAMMVAGRYVLDGYPYHIARDAHWGDLALGGFFNSLVFEALGVNLFTGRFLVAVFGALAIPGVYIMARRLFGWQAAFLASMFLLTQPLHVHFSRIAMYDIYDPTFCIVAVLLMWDGMEHGGRWKFALGGVLVGISQYYYAGALLWLFLIPAWWAVMFLRQPRQMMGQWLNLLIMVVSVILIHLPMVTFFEVRNMSMFSHSINMSQGQGDLDGLFGIGLEQLFKSSSRSIRAYIDIGDMTMHFDPSGETQLNLRWALLAFSLGCIVALRYALNPKILFLLMWMGMMLFFGGSLMLDTPGFSRYVTAMLPMAILAGSGVWWFLSYIRQAMPPATRQYILLVGVAAMLIVNIDDMRYLYGPHLRIWAEHMSINRVISDAVAKEATETYQQGFTPYFVFNENGATSDRQRLIEIYRYYCGVYCPYEEIIVTDPEREITEEWLESLRGEMGTYVFVLPSTTDPFDPSVPPMEGGRVALIKDAYPEATVARFNSSTMGYKKRSYDIPLFTEIYIPPSAKFFSDNSG